MKKNKEVLEGELVEENETPDEQIKQQEPAELEKMQALNNALINKLQQVTADYENFRNRSEKEKAHMYDRGIMAFAEGLLPVMDNFNLAMKNADPADVFIKGVLMIKNQLDHMFDDMGIKRIATVGEAFDTNLHSAISHIEDDAVGEKIITEEMQAGYTYKGQIIRHAAVVVAN
ncbi:MAG: nucleotide exchange factor GrpE [Defluviitaleaceae bacterium]|nr:nucleotide exchange factor GrpE [Defluviitaleaceae bacterium]